jgi:diguanylate cyclase (GGDEF)-like protein
VILVVLAVLAALRLVRTLRGQERLLRRSEIDPLTGLANRSAFTAGLATMIDWCVLSGAGVAVLFVDLDRFKAINDTLGHAAGDEVLVAVGHRLRSVVGDDDLVARFAGDEFVVAAAGIPSTAVAEELAERVRASLAAPVAAGQTVLTCTATVGAVFYAAVELPHLAETAIHEADLAMYRAKAATGTGRATPTVPTAVGTLAVGAGAGLPSGMERDGPSV